MNLDLTPFLDPLSYLPLDLWAWMMQIVPTALGVWSERSTQRLARGDYLFSLVVRVIGLLVLGWAVTTGVGYLVFTHDPASTAPAIDGVTALLAAATLMSLISGIVLARPLVRRLRDAGIDKRWGYFAVLPYLDFLMFVGLIFYPPSKSAADTPAPAVPQT